MHFELWANSFARPFQSTHCPAANLKLAHLLFPCHRGKLELGSARAWCPCGRWFSSTSISSTSSTSMSSSRLQQQRQRRWRQPFASSSLASSLASLLWKRARRHLGVASGAAEKRRGLRLGESAPSFLSCFFFSSLSTSKEKNEFRKKKERDTEREIATTKNIKALIFSSLSRSLFDELVVVACRAQAAHASSEPADGGREGREGASAGPLSELLFQRRSVVVVIVDLFFFFFFDLGVYSVSFLPSAPPPRSPL